MNKLIRRGSLAATAAIAVVLAGATGATAADTVNRLGGQDRIDTAIAASKNVYPDTETNNSKASYVVVARYDVYADALAATPLAEVAGNAPILLTQPGKGLDARVLAEIKRLNTENGDATLRVIIAGSEKGAVSAAAEQELVSAVGSANVFRVGGADRYETATLIADVIKTGKIGSTTLAGVSAVPTPQVYLARGDDFADALAAGAAAAEKGGVVLLTRGDKLEFFTNDYFNNNAVASANVVAVGGSAVTAAGTKAGVKLSGVDRYETAKIVAETFDSAPRVALASGQNFPDAVVAGAWAAANDAPVLLTKATETSPFTTVYFTANGNADVTVFGETGAVSKGVADAVKATLGATPVSGVFATSTSDAARTLTVKSTPSAKLTVTTKAGAVVASQTADTDEETIVTLKAGVPAGEVLVLSAVATNGAETAVFIKAPVVLSADAATVTTDATKITGKATPGADVKIAAGTGADVDWAKAATVKADANGVYTFEVKDAKVDPITEGSYTISATLAGAPNAFPVTVTAAKPVPAPAPTAGA
ncbi:cell wall-binding repeat-containing protein [Georgenia yuyongxinii]|uniref:Cell wall-binding repeat-containing protein n=1 Tax=Georgenia yuyongxinii TaxID=2589797 RepID=A0A5B8C608_9MICO|nr:cell wall-binding repeat-containing protein [Georgenia yuyongxinii]QDC25647.1 cell wall-binding repeat-containing protein [Georgenia yuyongxinii]